MSKRYSKKVLERLSKTAEKRKYLVKIHRPEIPYVDIAELRFKLNMTQEDFSYTFGLPLDDIKNWEQNRRRARGIGTKLYLYLISVKPLWVAKQIERLRKESEI